MAAIARARVMAAGKEMKKCSTADSATGKSAFQRIKPELEWRFKTSSTIS